MVTLASLLSGIFVYFAVGLLLGVAPARRLRGPRPKQASDRQVWLTQAGAKLTPTQFYLGSVIIGLVALVLFGAIAPTPAVAVIPAVAVGGLPAFYFARQRLERLQAVQRAWPDALRELNSAIAAGMSLERALMELATVGPEPIRIAFTRFPVLARMLGPVPALEIIKEELAHPTSDRVIEVLILAQHRGGHVLTTILDELIDATTDDLNTQEEIKTNALEGKLNARIVFVLPWFMLLAMTIQSPGYAKFYRSGFGVLVIVGSAIWSLFGLWLVSRLSRQRAEERVFRGAPPTVAGRW